MSRKLNAIRVLKNGQTINLIETVVTTIEDIGFIELRTIKDALIKIVNSIDDFSFIQIDSEYEIIKISYFSNTNKYLGTENIELADLTVLSSQESIENKKYNGIKELVRDTLENPLGSEIEKETHTQLLNKASYNNNARKYVMTNISKVLIKQDLVKPSKVKDYSYKLFSDLYGLGVIQELDDDSAMGEIIIIAKTFPKFNCDIIYIKNQESFEFNKKFKNLDELMRVFDKIISFNHKALNNTDYAKVEAIRANKDRINISIPDAAETYTLNIRKFSNFVPNKEEMRKNGTTNEFIDSLFKILVAGHVNIGIGGPMGVGKTTLANYLLTFTDPIEIKTVISSVNEIDIDRVLKGHKIISLLIDKEKGYTFANQMECALRTTSNRIIIPESRSNEFYYIHRANSQISGNIFTGHATRDEIFLDVCASMYKSSDGTTGESLSEIKDKIASTLPVIIIMRKIGNQIRIKSISEVLITSNNQFNKINRLCEWVSDPEYPNDPTKGYYERTKNRISDNLKNTLNDNGVPLSALQNF